MSQEEIDQLRQYLHAEQAGKRDWLKTTSIIAGRVVALGVIASFFVMPRGEAELAHQQAANERKSIEKDVAALQAEARMLEDSDDDTAHRLEEMHRNLLRIGHALQIKDLEGAD